MIHCTIQGGQSMKKKHTYFFIVVFFIGIFCALLFMGLHDKRTEIIWYLTYPEYYGVEMSEIEPYQEVKSERFELFNKRLKNLGIPAKVVFKYLPDSYEATEEEMEDGSWYWKELLDHGNRVENLLFKDEEADIVTFAPMEYDKFLVLDDYLEKEEIENVKKAIPEKVWKINKINGSTYQIPRGNIGVKETVYRFYKPFLEEYQIELNKEEMKAMNPKEVIEWLLPYFEEGKLLDGRYYLTSAMDLNYENYFLGKEIPILTGINNNFVLDTQTCKVEDLLHAEGLLSGMELYQWIYSNDIDCHENPAVMSALPVFTIGDIAMSEELSNEQSKDPMWEEIELDNEILSASIGNGVLKESDHPELSVRVLAASMYDEELSNIMIYGIPNEDYILDEGHAVYTKDRLVSCMGSFSEVGNNLIAYPNEKEVLDKRERSEQLLQRVKIIPYSNFVPHWDQEFLEESVKLSAVYREISLAVMFSEIPDLEMYLKKQEEILEQAGAEKILAKLQSQVNQWEESGDDF